MQYVLELIGAADVLYRGSTGELFVPTSFSSRSDPNFNGQFILAGVVSDIVFRTTIENLGPDTAYNLELVFTHPTVLAYSRVEDGGQFTCETDQSRTVTTCTVTNALAFTNQVSVITALASFAVTIARVFGQNYLCNFCLHFLHYFLFSPISYSLPPVPSLSASYTLPFYCPPPPLTDTAQMQVAIRFVILSGMISGNVAMLNVVATATT